MNDLAINMRQGNDADFDPTKLTAGEFAFLHNSKRIAAAFKDGTVKYMQTTEDAEEYLAQADEHLNEVKKYTSQAEAYAKQVEEDKIQAGQYRDDSALKADLSQKAAQAAASDADSARLSAEQVNKYTEDFFNNLGIRYAYPKIQNIRISFTDCSSDFIFAHKEILIPEETVFWGTPIRGPSGVYEKSTGGKCIEYIKIFSGGGAEAGITITGITLTMIRPDRAEPEEYSFTPIQSMIKSDKADISYGDGTCRIECSGPYQGAYIYLPCISGISYEEMKALYQLIDSEELDREVNKSINETN